MNNLHLFELINAAPGLDSVHLYAAVVLAQWLIYLLPAVMVLGWIRGDDTARRDLLQMLLAAVISLILAQVVMHLWPQPRPFALHLGTQYLAHADEPGLPSDHVTVIWSLALAALGTRRYAVVCFPLLALGLIVGWSRVYLGVHFPYDVLAAFPVAAAGAITARLLRGPATGLFDATLHLYDRLEQPVCTRLRLKRKSPARKT